MKPESLRCFRFAAPAVGAAFVAVFVASASPGQTPPQAVRPAARGPVVQIPVVFSGGHDTDPRDGGRPVVLIAAALGVPTEVFREAFRQVRPARAGTAPEPGQVRENKAALMNALGRYGVTNERLDAVSNYYRYVRSRGELWPTRPARAYAVVEKGVVARFVVTDGGSGYTSPPTVTVPGVALPSVKVDLSFAPFADRNGSIAAVTVAQPAPHDTAYTLR